jgi:very-short-patch-repair endonuclease
MPKLGNPSEFDFYFGASHETIARAKELRTEMTPAEKLLWSLVRNRKIAGLKFRRQHPIGKYIADFYCPEKKLVIELDGGIHDTVEQKEHDEGRTAEIENYELKIIRFKNEEVINDSEEVLKKIKENIY